MTAKADGFSETSEVDEVLLFLRKSVDGRCGFLDVLAPLAMLTIPLLPVATLPYKMNDITNTTSGV